MRELRLPRPEDRDELPTFRVGGAHELEDLIWLRSAIANTLARSAEPPPPADESPYARSPRIATARNPVCLKARRKPGSEEIDRFTKRSVPGREIVNASLGANFRPELSSIWWLIGRSWLT